MEVEAVRSFLDKENNDHFFTSQNFAEKLNLSNVVKDIVGEQCYVFESIILQISNLRIKIIFFIVLEKK